MYTVPVPPTVLPPYLTASHGSKCCSLCHQSFPADSKPSISTAFKQHVLEVHRAKQEAGQDSAKTKANRAD